MSQLREQIAYQRPTRTRRTDGDDLVSLSPHRAGHSTGIHPEDHPYSTDEQRRPQPTHRPVQPVDDELDDDDLYPKRMPTSTRRYRSVEEQGTRAVQATQPKAIVRYHYQQVPPRRSRTTQTQERPPVQQPQPKQATHRREWHWLVSVGLTMIVGLAVFVVGTIAFTWWHTYQDDLHYGRPRTAQYDVRVGHDDAHMPSHFLALNLNKQVEVIELPAGDATKAKVYIGPTLIGDGQELTPVTLEFKDVNRDGKPDMILHIGESRIVFINDNGAFRPVKPSDTITL